MEDTLGRERSMNQHFNYEKEMMILNHEITKQHPTMARKHNIHVRKIHKNHGFFWGWGGDKASRLQSSVPSNLRMKQAPFWLSVEIQHSHPTTLPSTSKDGYNNLNVTHKPAPNNTETLNHHKQMTLLLSLKTLRFICTLNPIMNKNSISSLFISLLVTQNKTIIPIRQTLLPDSLNPQFSVTQFKLQISVSQISPLIFPTNLYIKKFNCIQKLKEVSRKNPNL